MSISRALSGLVLALGGLASLSGDALAQGLLSLTRICISKFEDVNGNGVRDPGEPPVENTTFNLFGPSVLSTGKTDPLGQLCFPVQKNGTYTVREVVPPGWQSTNPASVPVQKTVLVAQGVASAVVFGNRRTGPQPAISKIDLGIDTSFGNVSPPARNPAALNIWIRADQTIPIGSELIVQGSLMPGTWFAPFTPSTVTQGWACTGNWNAFLCRTKLTAPLSSPQGLILQTSYAASRSGSSHNYSAQVWMRYNADPGPMDHSLTQMATLF